MNTYDPTDAERLVILGGAPPQTEPTPLAPQITPPPFPAEILPAWLGDFTTALATSTQTPPDMAGMFGLSVLASVCGRRVIVKPKPDWTEPTNLYVAVLLPPGERKTSVVSALLAPLDTYETELVEAGRDERARALFDRKVLEGEQRRHENDASKATTTADKEQAVADGHRVAEALEAFTVPPVPVLYVSDSTPEHVKATLVEQGGRLAVFSDEGGPFDLLTRYASKGSGPNLDAFLQGHAADGTLKTGTRSHGIEQVTRPTLTVGVAVQPDVLAALADVRGAEGRGLLARFLWIRPASLVGRRDQTPPTVPDTTRDTYAATLVDLARFLDEAASDAPRELTLSADAARLLLDFRTELEPRLGEDGDLHHLGKWANKLAGAVVRIAGILHIADTWRDGIRTPITGDTMAKAITLGGYALDHARAVLGSLGADPDLAKAVKLLALIRRKHLDTFTASGLMANHVSRPSKDWPKVPELRATLDLLDDYGWITTEGTGKGTTYHAHPAAFDKP